MPDESPSHIHLVGIGGVGMSALARLLVESGCRVSGSDLADGPAVDALRAIGVTTTIGHTPAAIAGATTVVASPAIPWRNAELTAARDRGVPVLSRAEALAMLLERRQRICVAGSHGKTTSTAMLAHILEAAGRGPGFMVGGLAPVLGGVPARLGQGEAFVLEACEAFGALAHWHPHHCLLTNIDDEHDEHYGGHDRLRAAFAAMLARVPAEGTIVLCGDDHGALTLVSSLPSPPDRPVVTFGLGVDNVLRADQVRARPDGCAFRILRDGVPCGRMQLPIPGIHNVRNALGALAMAMALGVSFGKAAAALKTFTGVGLRWQPMDRFAGTRLYRDCAHHPTEIEATLAVARSCAGDEGRVAVLLRPQLHSRVGRLAGSYTTALAAADQVLLLPVDGAGEHAPAIGSDARLAGALAAAGVPFRPFPAPTAAYRAAAAWLRPGDVLVAMGPGALDPPAAEAPSAPDRVVPQATLLQHFLERRAALSPDAICLEDGGLAWTYAELDELGNQAARYLRNEGAGPGRLVVLHLDRSVRLLALLLGTLKAGAAYLPVDPAIERDSMNRRLADDPCVCVIVTDRGWQGPRVRKLDTIWPEILREDTAAPCCKAAASDLAYAIFTSGSTGEAKLVGVEHRSIVNLIRYATTVLLEPEDLRVVPFIDSIGFDAAVHQVFTTLTHGGTLLVANDLAGVLRSPDRERITSLGTTPAMLRRMLDGATLPASVRVIGLGGEVIPESLIGTILRAGSVRKVLNYYGPTEATIYATVDRVLDNLPPPGTTGRVLGHPVAATRIRVIAEDGTPAPDGETGEIHIGGLGLARGYLGDPALTADRFIFDSDGERWYRTGDRGWRLKDGRLVFAGRADNQFKLRGVRLEPGEIESQIIACPAIRQAAVAPRMLEDGTTHLVAFAVAPRGMDLDRLQAWLRPHLPALMIPTRLVLLDRMPLTPGGKLDRTALEHIAVAPPPARPPAASPRNDTEARALAIWREVLDNDQIGIDDDFLAVGGDSLASVRIILTTEAAFGIRLDTQGTLTTVAALSERIATAPPAGRTDDAARVPILRRQWMHVASWAGHRRTPGSLIVTLNPHGRRRGLFWCLQGYAELVALAAVLGEDQPVHGMRSGHLVMRYTPETLDVLAALYAEEIMELQPTGDIRIGGNCQGGTVARLVAMKLQASGRRVAILFQMELNTFREFGAPVSLIFGRDSMFNPYRSQPDADAMFRRCYPAGFTVDAIDGSHGSFFSEPHVAGLGEALRGHLA